MTHNQYIAFFRTFAVNHFQINSFSNGKKQEYTATSEGQTPTVTMWAVLGDTTVTGNVRQSKYTFLFADIINKDKSNLDEVLSDTKRIAEDFIAVLRSPDYDANFQIENVSQLTPFEDELFDNESAGWELEITFNSDYDADVCQIPSLGLPNASGGYTLIIDQDGNIVAQVPDGGTYEVLVASGIDEGNSTTTYSNQVIDL